MNDREMLELAAKAAGWFAQNWAWVEGEGFVYQLDGRRVVWNPLTDDGDALRLACILRINIEHAETLSRKAHGVNCWPVGRGDCGYMENDLADYPAATRRAITRAAAVIGRAMK